MFAFLYTAENILFITPDSRATVLWALLRFTCEQVVTWLLGQPYWAHLISIARLIITHYLSDPAPPKSADLLTELLPSSSRLDGTISSSGP